MRELQGACLCGAVRYAVIPPTKWCAHCHCRQCQTSHGAAFVTWFGVADAQFRITAGEEDLVWHQSSAPARRGFCRHCGSRLFFRSERWPGETHVALATLADPLDRAPSAHVFFDSHAGWAPVAGELPRYGGVTGTEPLPRTE
jgi:hypothetical protein